MEQILFFVGNLPAQENVSWYLDAIKWLASSLIGALITYYFTRQRDKGLDAKKEFNDLTAISNSICFYLALQQSELTKLSKDVKDRIDAFQKLCGGDASRDNRIRITQDFTVCKNLNIDIEAAGKIILSITERNKDVVGILQDVFINNEWYFKTIAMLEKFNDFKRSMAQVEHGVDYIFQFVESNFPEYEKQIDQTKSFGKKTLDSFRESMGTYFGVKINVTMGEVFQVGGDSQNTKT